MKKFKKNAVLFAVGGSGYSAIEFLWRGRTHWSMAAAGGLCFLLFADRAERFRLRPLPVKALISALDVTAVEFGFGLVFNRWLKQDVWDYSGMPGNLLGQICPQYTLCWAVLALAGLPLADALNRKLGG
ncbi:MAG: hypothetical protein E7223_01860 [Clostridiales bacterium]|nr:hypothetical protein [Clostridiales bacterium]